MLSTDSAVKRHVLSSVSVPVPFVSMSASTPGEESTLGERLSFAIHKERHRGSNAVENALMVRHPELFRSRGFLSSYISGRRGKKGNPDPRAMKVIADYLHVAFEWLMIGSGPLRRGGRGETAWEQAMFTARDWGIREDAIQVAWERNKDRAETMSPEDCFSQIQIEAERLDRGGVLKPAAVMAQKEGQARVRREKAKIARQKSAKSPAPKPVTEEPTAPRRIAIAK